MTPASFKRALLQLLLLPVCALAILTCILALQIRSLESSAAWVDRTDQIIARINELTGLMIDEESGIHDYLLTGRGEFLYSYTRARSEIDLRFQQLQLLVKDSSQVERLAELSAQKDAWEDFSARRLQGSRGSEKVFADSLSAKTGMNQMHMAASQFIKTEDTLRAQRSAHARFRSRMTYTILPLLAALAAALISIYTRRIFYRVAKVRAEREWLDTTLRGIGDAVIACDPGGRVVFMNVVAETLTGWTESDARGHALSQAFNIVNETTRATVVSPVDNVFLSGKGMVLASDTVLVRRDGSEIAIDDSANPVHNAEGTLIGVVLVFRDVSENRRMERALRFSEAESRAVAAELEAIMQVVPALTFIAHDARCERVTSSLMANELLRVAPDVNSSHLSCPESRPQGYRLFKNGKELPCDEFPLRMAAASAAHVRDCELTIMFADGSSSDIFGNAAPLFDESGEVRGAVAAFIDITERKRAEATLRKTEKLAFAGRMAASMSHEINNPLETVTNLLYLLENASSLNKAREYTKVAQEELARVTSIVTQTLRFYRQSTRAIAVSLPMLLDSALSLYARRLSSAGISVERRYDDSASLYAYDGELRQVFLNLIGNAFDATRNVGKQLLVRERQAINWKTGCKGIRVTVADTGRGMDRNTLERLFEPFFSTKGDTGTGLGLWISKGIIEKHCGSIRVRSSQSLRRRGTIFSIFFPFDAIPNTEDSTAAMVPALPLTSV